MNGVEQQLLGCLVRDIQTGSPVGWVTTIVFDPEGERVTELVVDPLARPRGFGASTGGSERLLGHPLFDAAGRYLGEIVDLVMGMETGKLQSLVVERSPGEQDVVRAHQGVLWERDHWTLLEEAPRPRVAFMDELPEPPEQDDPANDWMVGQRALVRLTDRRGQVIVEPGQRITAGMVERASRAGVLHRLEAEFEPAGKAGSK